MLTIGEFSRLGRVSPRMLRHYDALGLLCPETVGENSTPGATVKSAYEACATVLHKGPYDGIPGACEALAAWMAQHPEYRICGPAIDRYLNDPDNTPPEELVTGILFPVEKV